MQFPNPIVDELTVAGAGNPFTYVKIYDNGSLGLPIIEFASSIGRTFKLVSLHETDLAIFADNLPTNVAQYFVQDTGIAFIPGGGTDSGILIDVNDGFMKWGTYTPGDPPVFTYDTWTAATLLSGFAGSVDYKLLPTGEVIFRGNVSGAAGLNVTGTDILQMPVGYRPTITSRWESSNGAGGAGDTAGRIQITSGGLAEVARPCGGATSFYFDGVRYSVI